MKNFFRRRRSALCWNKWHHGDANAVIRPPIIVSLIDSLLANLLISLCKNRI